MGFFFGILFCQEGVKPVDQPLSFRPVPNIVLVWIICKKHVYHCWINGPIRRTTRSTSHVSLSGCVVQDLKKPAGFVKEMDLILFWIEKAALLQFVITVQDFASLLVHIQHQRRQNGRFTGIGNRVQTESRAHAIPAILVDLPIPADC